MYVCTHVRMHACMHVFMQACIIWRYACMYWRDRRHQKVPHNFTTYYKLDTLYVCIIGGM